MDLFGGNDEAADPEPKRRQRTKAQGLWIWPAASSLDTACPRCGAPGRTIFNEVEARTIILDRESLKGRLAKEHTCKK